MAMEAEELTIPEFLENSSEDEIHAKMLDNLPSDIDKAEGGFPWDFTRPTAIEISEMKEYVLVEVLKTMFPSTCEESYFLDLHGAARGIIRREAVSATGYVQVEAPEGTEIPIGFTFSTEADDDGNTVEFNTTEDATVDETGVCLIPVEADEGGTEGNVLPNTVVLQVGDEDGNEIDEITSITNPEAMTGGVDEEDDDDYRERIVDFYQSANVSYVGNVADYKRWAMSVEGIGSVTVIPAEDSSGTVTLILTDTDGQPANEALRQAVYDYIMSPDNPEERLAPIGAELIIAEMDTATINVAATVYLDEASLEQAISSIKSGLTEYLSECIETGIVRVSSVCKVILDVDGVTDYSGVSVTSDGHTTADALGNLSVDAGYIPVLGELEIVEG